jgi:hypothetical protein
MTSDGKKIATADIFSRNKKDWTVVDIEVDEQFRRAGIATKIYNTFEELGYRLIPSSESDVEYTYLSPDGEKFWTSRKLSRNTKPQNSS